MGHVQGEAVAASLAAGADDSLLGVHLVHRLRVFAHRAKDKP